ncbi:MAG TPA: PTS fructose transporter subunit IIA [Candidatus Limicola stercorigallinarum]|nr:PTS fructose transporter subunit IIA [Candidatus Limicola stercorigallinarum]
MRYLVLVSHGTLAQGVHSVLKMLMGEREDVKSTSLQDGMGADEYIANLKELLGTVTPSDEVLLLGDIVGGSPLTNALNVLSELGLLPRTVALGGMNLPMAMTALMGLQTQDMSELAESMVNEARSGARRIAIVQDSDEDEDEI